MLCPRCRHPLSIEPPVTDGGVVMQRAHCLPCGRDVWREIPHAVIPTPAKYARSEPRAVVVRCRDCFVKLPVGVPGGQQERCAACRVKREADKRHARDHRYRAKQRATRASA